jgi:flagellar protein FlaG
MNITPLATPVARKTDDPSVAGAGSRAGQATDVQAREKAAPEPSREEVTKALKQINDAMPSSATRLEFSLDDDTRQTIVKIVDQSTKEVVRQIPTVEALQIAKSLDKLAGLLINQTA